MNCGQKQDHLYNTALINVYLKPEPFSLLDTAGKRYACCDASLRYLGGHDPRIWFFIPLKIAV